MKEPRYDEKSAPLCHPACFALRFFIGSANDHVSSVKELLVIEVIHADLRRSTEAQAPRPDLGHRHDRRMPRLVAAEAGRQDARARRRLDHGYAGRRVSRGGCGAGSAHGDEGRKRRRPCPSSSRNGKAGLCAAARCWSTSSRCCSNRISWSWARATWGKRWPGLRASPGSA